MLLRYALSTLVSVCSVLAADGDTESTITSTVESFVTVTVKPPTTSASASSTNGLGNYIMQGLGDASSSSNIALPAPITIAPFPTSSNTTNATAGVGWQACQTSQILWSDGWTSAFRPEVITSTHTYTIVNATITFNVTFGNADVYTTIDGIPHAHGELEPTSVSQFVDTYIETEKSTSTFTTTMDATYLEPSPSCTIAPSKCTALWQSYLGEQGMPTILDNATEPAITPMPTDRPRCALGNVTAICEKLPKPSCVFSARKVDLFYWPEVTAAPNASLASSNSSAVATQIVGNITMTSPSVYLIFDHLQAISSTDLDMKCVQSTPLGATGQVSWQGGGAISLVGGPYTNAVVSLDPTSLTSLVRDLGPVNTASVVSEIAHGGPSYDYWVNAVHGTRRNYNGQNGYYSSVLAKPVDYANFKVPDAEAYYMNINVPPGCNRMGDHPECSTIFDGAYRAQLLVPEQVRTLRPEWAECYDPLFGALDPPIALTPAASIKVPTKEPDSTPDPPKETPSEETPAGKEPKEPSPSPAIPGPTPPSEPSPTPPPPKDTPTAQPATNPDADKPAFDNDSTSDDQPASDGKPASNDNSEPASNKNAAPKDNSASNDSPDSSPNGAGSNNDAQSSTQDDAPKHPPNEESNESSDSESTGNGQSGSSSVNGQPSGGSSNNKESASGPSGSNDQNSNSGSGSNDEESDNKPPQNALDVLSAAQQDNEAKETASPAAGSSLSGGNDSDESGNADGTTESSEASHGGSNSGSDGGSNGDSTNEQSSAGAQSGSNDAQSPGDSTTAGSGTDNGQAGQDNNSDSSSGTNNLPSDQIIEIDGTKHTIAASGGVPIIDGTTLVADASHTTINGQAVSVADGSVVIGTQTILLPSEQPTSQEAVFVANGQRFTAAPGNSDDIAVVDGKTLTVGGSAADVNGVSVSAASDGIVINGSPMTYSNAVMTGSTAVLTLDSTTATATRVSSNVFAIGSVTLTAGGSDATVSGHTISAASTGLVVDGEPDDTGTGVADETQGVQSTDSQGQIDDSPATGSGASKLGVASWFLMFGYGMLQFM